MGARIVGSTLRKGLPLLVSAVVFLAPIALVVAAPSLDAIPAAADVSTSLPALPAQVPGASRTLAGLLDSLPMVVASFPDPASTSAAAEFDHLRALQTDDPVQMFVDAWAGLNAPGDSGGSIPAFGTFLLTNSEPNGGDQSAYDAQASTAFPLLTADPDNADRISNAAVALFVAGVASVEGAPPTPSTSLATPATLLRNSLRLLVSATSNFGLRRPAVLNLAYFLSLDPVQLQPLGNSVVEGAPDPVTGLLDRWLTLHPADVTAQYMAASQNAASAAPLIADPATAALGYAAQGDAALAEAEAPAADAAPGASRQSALKALDRYDAALSLSADPGLYAGRARALHLVGADRLAVEAQRAAVDRAPGSAELLLALARLQGSAGDFGGMRASARAAETAVDSGWVPLVKDIRYVRTTDPTRRNTASCADTAGVAGNGRGLFGYSAGSDRDHIPIWHLEQVFSGCGGAGQVFIDQLVPQTRDPDFDNRVEKAALIDGAAVMAIEASMLMGDTAGADADQSQWQAAIQDPHLSGDPNASLNADAVGSGATYLSARQGVIDLADAAAHLVHGVLSPVSASSPNQVLAFAETVLREFRRFAAAAAMCHAAAGAGYMNPADQGASRPYSEVSALACEGESAYLAGNITQARDVLQRAYGDLQANPDLSVQGEVAGDLVAASVRLKQFDVATQILQAQVANPNGDATSQEKLGEVSLERGDVARAIPNFSAVIWSPHFASGRTDYVVELAHSNRGVALLRQVQPATDQPPDCGAHRAQCRAAQSDLTTAVAADPGNAVFFMNLAWADRALSDTPGEVRNLTRALQIDPTLFPAWNDIGVVAADEGDTQGAQKDFERAISLNPSYDIAVWNLGVSELSRGVQAIPRGEALMARATRLDRSLTGVELAYRTDERIYTVHVLSSSTMPFSHSYSIAAVVLGSFGAAFVILLIVGDVVVEGGRDAIVHAGRSRLVAPTQRLVRRVLSRVPTLYARCIRLVAVLSAASMRWRLKSRPWLVTFPFLALITVVVAVWTNSEARLSAVATALFAAALAVVAHEIGHTIAARRLGYSVAPAPWAFGIVISMIMLPFRLVGGPYVGHQAEPADGASVVASARTHLLVIAAGPFANLVVAVMAAVLYVIQPLPVLLLIMLLQVGMAAFSLLPSPPMEGWEISHRHPLITLAALLAIVATASLFTAGVI